MAVELTSCLSPQKILEQKKYDRAFNLALKKLKQHKEIVNNKNILSISIKEIIKQQSTEINRFKNTGHLEKALFLTQKLQTKINAADAYLLYQVVDQKKQFDEEEQHLKAELSNNFMLDGMKNLAVAEETDVKANAKKAYFSFKKAKKYNSNIEQLDSLMQSSFKLAQKTYIIEANAPFDLLHSWDIDRKFDDLTSSGGQFITVYYKPTGKIDSVDCTIKIDFDNLCIQEKETKEERTFSKEIVIGNETITNANGETEEIEQTKEISGKVIIKNIVKTADWGVQTKVKAGSKNCLVANRSFSEDLKDEIEEYILEGDKRAIPNSYKFIQNNDELMSDSDMVDELINELYTEVKLDIF